MLKPIGKLSPKQSGVLRDAGLTKEEVETFSYFDYEKVRDELCSKRKKDPAIKTQIVALQKLFPKVDISSTKLSYPQAKTLLREAALAMNDDPDYVSYINWQADMFNGEAKPMILERSNATPFEKLIDAL